MSRGRGGGPAGSGEERSSAASGADAPDGSSEAPHPEARQQAVEVLCEAFADDQMAVEEFERRIDAVHAATSASELRALLADLPGPRPPVRTDAWEARGRGARREEGSVRTSGASARSEPAVAGRRPDVPPDQVREQSLVLGFMGGGGRSGPWTPARTNWVMGILGGAEVDFREARMPPGVTEVKVFALWGGAQIIVPPDIRVECSGVGILGGFEETHTTASTTDPDAPLLRVTGAALMGGFEVTVRYPGESARDARRRRKEERKARKRLRSGREPHA